MAGQNYIGNVRSSPRWLGDYATYDMVIMPVPARIDPTQFTTSSGVNVTLTSNAAQGATTIAVTALTLPFAAATTIISGGSTLIPAGTLLYFGGAKVAQLTAAAAIGATSITVAALPTALVTGDTTQFNQYGADFVPSGTVIGRTWTMRDAGTAYRPGLSTDNQLYLTLFDTVNALTNPDVELVRPNTTIKENYLPGYGNAAILGTSASPTALLTALRGLYRCIFGKD